MSDKHDEHEYCDATTEQCCNPSRVSTDIVSSPAAFEQASKPPMMDGVQSLRICGVSMSSKTFDSVISDGLSEIGEFSAFTANRDCILLY